MQYLERSMFMCQEQFENLTFTEVPTKVYHHENTAKSSSEDAVVEVSLVSAESTDCLWVTPRDFEFGDSVTLLSSPWDDSLDQDADVIPVSVIFVQTIE